MADAPKANAVVGQSGGPTGVINASLVGVIEEACKHAQIENLYGAVHAVSGIVKEEFVDLKGLSPERLEIVAGTPSASLGSSRDKPDKAYCERIFDVFKKRNIRYFYYIGGNDSANTAHIINEMAAEVGYDLRAFHIPKTVDNDLLVTDHCPGYGTAAKFVACAVMGDDMDNRALGGVKIDVIMGRHAGFLAAAAGLARQGREDDGPHLVYVPERPVGIDKLMTDVDACYSKYGRCVIAVSEGICDADGEPWAKKLAENAEVDAHGNIQLSGGALADFLAAEIKTKLNIKRLRADTFGYLQRSFAGLQSSVDAAEARCCGNEAVKMSLEYESGSVAMKRTGEGADYGVTYERTDLCNVAEKTKELPDEFINADGNGVTQAFIDYALPLTGGLPQTDYVGSDPKV